MMKPVADSDTGVLYIVATPIGNLEDITFRALKTLETVDVIACEDTRQTLKLLRRYNIKKKMISYFQPHEKKKIPLIIELMKSNKNVALVSDSGTPGISDPGFPLIREALKQHLEVIPIPGPCAAVTALSASGLPNHRFLFIGFIPPKTAGQKKLLRSLKNEISTLVFYCPARKLETFLKTVSELYGDRQIVVARELTKIHEEFIRGTPEEIAQSLNNRPLKGEVTVLIEGQN